MGHKQFRDYAGVLPAEQFRQVQEQARRLEGLRVLQINATAAGGGVAALLSASTPLLVDLGLEAEWAVLKPSNGFFEITKRIHNALQGAPVDMDDEDWAEYEAINRSVADEIHPEDWDVIVVHDPQPLAVRQFQKDAGKAVWVWRSHIDTSRPHPPVRARIAPYVDAYQAAVFTLPQYVMDGIVPRHVAIQPGIDPLDPKNRSMPKPEAQRIVAGYGIDASRPLITQVSRFDPWKDPLGVVETWRLARRQAPGLQLALVGQTADDDPEAAGILAKVRAMCGGLRDCHIVADQASDRDVNAFQVASDVILQKSIREGFGLSVSEALWSGTPVIGGEAGGIPLQIEHGRTGFLVGSPEEAAQFVVQLVRNPKHADEMGRAGRETVRQQFLLPRMIRDELQLWDELVAGRGPAADASL